jgi:hypothetical protein
LHFQLKILLAKQLPLTDSIPPTNPETTIGDGLYGWNVAPNNYEVMASAPSYSSSTTASFTVPPAVTDLNIQLTPTAGCGVHIGEVQGKGKLGDEVHFKFKIESKDGTTFKGKLDYNDKAAHIDLDSKTITSLSILSGSGDIKFGGTAKLDDHTTATFQVDATDPDSAGGQDTFSITITGGTTYTNSGDVNDGQIEIVNDQPNDHDKDDHHDDNDDGENGDDHHDGEHVDSEHNDSH